MRRGALAALLLLALACGDPMAPTRPGREASGPPPAGLAGPFEVRRGLVVYEFEGAGGARCTLVTSGRAAWDDPVALSCRAGGAE